MPQTRLEVGMNPCTTASKGAFLACCKACYQERSTVRASCGEIHREQHRRLPCPWVGLTLRERGLRGSWSSMTSHEASYSLDGSHSHSTNSGLRDGSVLTRQSISWMQTWGPTQVSWANKHGRVTPGRKFYQDMPWRQRLMRRMGLRRKSPPGL